MDDDQLPYHRYYASFLSCFPVIGLLLFCVVPGGEYFYGFPFRKLLALFSISFASLWSPVMIYVGIRIRNLPDFLSGIIGTSTLLFWVPMMINQ